MYEYINVGVLMKVIAGLLASISIVLAGCGGGSYSETNMTQNNQPFQNIGGGGSSGGGVSVGGTNTGSSSTSPTFNLAKGLANLAKVGSTKELNISGSSAGTLVFTNIPETSTALFEGSTRSVVTVNRKFSLDAPCGFGSIDLATTNYYDSNYNQVGYINSNSHAVPRIPFDAPVNVHVGDAGGIGIFDLYTDSSKTNLIGQVDYFYTISTDEPASPSSVKVAFSSWILSNKIRNIKETRIYRLNLDSQMTLLSIEFTTHMPLELDCRLVAKTKD
jgi:hypothetical protein